MKWGAAILGCVMLLGCAQEPEPKFLPDGYRDRSVQITSSTRFDPAAFAGDWVVIESFDETPRPVTVARLSFQVSPMGFLYQERLPQGEQAQAVPLSIGRFGRLNFADPERDPIWVLWIDEDHRTAVLGTPSGRMGRIINRGRNLRADRLKAARDVLAFNGYDLSKLQRVAR